MVKRGGRFKYWPCDNLSNATSCFTINPQDYAKACDWGDVVSIVHSHPNMLPVPSEIDRQACVASGLPWHIVSCPRLQWAYLEPAGHTPDLIGREWVHGTMDCYTLLQDWYRMNEGIYLSDYDRQPTWWNKGDDLYQDHFTAEGFTPVPMSTIRPGDALLMAVGSRVPNHAAVFLGDNVILHHVMGRLSGRDVLDATWRRRITHVLRYADNPFVG